MPLITVAEAKTQIPVLSSGTADDSLITTLILEADRIMARFCGYPGTAPTMASTSYTRDFDGDGTRNLRLDVWPVTAITSAYDDLDQTFGADTLVASADYAIVNARTLRLTATAAHGTWQEGTENVRVAFTAGYTTIDEELKRLCAILVRHLYDARVKQGTETKSQGESSATYTPAALMPVEVRQGLGPYMLPRAIL